MFGKIGSGPYCASHPDNIDLYRKNKSKEDAISLALHSAVDGFDDQNTYAMILFLTIVQPSPP